MPSDYSPQFSYVIVQKRISTRILLKGGPKMYDNPPPGTVVDNTITRYRFMDFFLIPQAVNQVSQTRRRPRGGP